MVDRLVNEGQEKVVVVDSLVSTGHRAAVHPDAVFTKETWRIKTSCALFLGTCRYRWSSTAAYSLVAESMADPLKYFDNNTAGMVKLWKSCMNVGCTIVFLQLLPPWHSRRNSDFETTPQKKTD